MTQTVTMLKPFNEAQRLQVLRSYCALESGANDALDRLTRLACHLFSIPIAVVSLVDADEQVFKSRHGLESRGTPREHAFCSHAILGREALVVTDATLDRRFADNPLVTGEPGIRFYAGFPLITPIGFRLGAFCLIDTVPRDDFDAAKYELLEDLATLAMLALKSDSQHAAPSGLDVIENVLKHFDSVAQGLTLLPQLLQRTFFLSGKCP